MIVDVVFLRRGIERPFNYLYKGEKSPLGYPVVVPLHNQLTVGLVTGVNETPSQNSEYKLKEVEKLVETVEPLPVDLLRVGCWMEDYYISSANAVFKTILPEKYLPKPDLAWELLDEKQFKRLVSAEIYRLFEGRNEVQFEQLKKQLDLSEGQLIKQLEPAVNKGLLSKKINLASASTSRLKLNYLELIGSAQEQQIFLQEATDRQRQLLEFLQPLGGCFQSDLPTELRRTNLLKTLAQKKLINRRKEYKDRRPLKQYRRPDPRREKHQLSSEQAAVFSSVKSSTEDKEFAVHLLHGVTGSGKTEVYCRLAEALLEQECSTLILVPEITLAAFLFQRLESRFGQHLAILHSGLSAGERRDEWDRIQRGEARVVLGVQSAVFAPLKKLGLIVVDEEHDSSYKAGDNPRYHARDVAIKRAQFLEIPVLLGSATPSVESYANQFRSSYIGHSMVERPAGGALPSVKFADLRGSTSILTETLKERTGEVLKRGNRAIWFLNRRGHSNFLLCNACGEALQCCDCHVSMTYHSKPGLLRCHYCGYAARIPRNCPYCDEKQLQLQGTGTQQLENMARELYPGATIIRMDADTVSRKNSRLKLLNEFANSEGGLLLGTQMVTKGLDFQRLDFVGVINVDTGLNFPDFRAGERTFQQLVQVCGRAGREKSGAEVLVQTYRPDHYSIQLAARGNFKEFFRREIYQRKQLNYPPFSRLIDFVAVSSSKSWPEEILQKLRELLPASSQLEILGPIPCVLEKIKKQYRWHLIVKGKIDFAWRKTVREIVLRQLKIRPPNRLLINVDPMDML